MKWTAQQDAALKAAAHWLEHSSEQVFRIFGFAGTGKTTLAKHLAEDVSGRVLYAAYTGKAANVLRSKGCANAATLHSLMYHAKERSKAELKSLEQALLELPEQPQYDKKRAELIELIKKERENAARPSFTLNTIDSPIIGASLIVVDEASMIADREGYDLLSFGVKVLVLGDPAQLPPVMGTGFFTNDAKPDVLLTDIQRQALDNPIIAMATKVREGDKLELGTYGESRVIMKEDLDAEQVLAADQLLVGRNKTRRSYNLRIRQLLGMENVIDPGERIVCLRNDHQFGLLNGSLWNITDIGSLGKEESIFSIVPEEKPDAAELEVLAHMHFFQGREQELPYWTRKDAQEFDYGYAITTHKAQGSQWDDVMVIDESWCFRDARKNWLYTAITRAAERVTVVKT